MIASYCGLRSTIAQASPAVVRWGAFVYRWGGCKVITVVVVVGGGVAILLVGRMEG